ncbi:MAG: glycosyltransferase family 2 protein [Lachnospiraceae bacterium]|nr:glycosyltransferase family 2 protein [Lachnospiraceae bacterium]
MAKVTIVIPNYNGERFLNDCFNSLMENITVTEGSSDAVDFDITVVDNGSTDRSIDIINNAMADMAEKTGGRCRLELIRLDRNYGFPRAVNEGIKSADTEYVILLNNDTRVYPDFVSKLTKTIEKDKTVFSVSARMLKMYEPDKIDNAGDLYCALGWAFARGKDKPVSLYEKKCDIFSSCAGAAIYRKKVFERIGYFDEDHFAYLEDVDAGYRARINGYRNVYEPGAVVLHAGSGSSGSRYNKFKIDLSSRNNVYVVYKNMPLLQLIINLPFLMAGTVIKTLFFIKKGEGLTYIKGLCKGVSMCFKGKKYPYKNANLGNYLKIQLELWRNVFIRVLG